MYPPITNLYDDSRAHDRVRDIRQTEYALLPATISSRSYGIPQCSSYLVSVVRCCSVKGLVSSQHPRLRDHPDTLYIVAPPDSATTPMLHSTEVRSS